MARMIPLIMWSGISIAYFNGVLISTMSLTLPQGTIEEEKSSNQKIMLAMVTFGIGEIIGSMLNGKIVDKLGSRKTVFVDLFIIVIMGIAT